MDGDVKFRYVIRQTANDSYVTENKAILAIIFCVQYVAVSRLHGKVAYMDGMDGKIQFLPALLALNVG